MNFKIKNLSVEVCDLFRKHVDQTTKKYNKDEIDSIDELDVWLGVKNKVKVYTKNNIYKTIPKARKKYLKAKIIYNGPIMAPIKKDDVIGKLIINYKNEILSEHDLLAFEKVDKVNILTRLIRSINYLIWGDV